MKRVCTLRKVLRSFSKVLLEKLFFIVLISWLFVATQFLLPMNISSQEICYGMER